MPALVKMLFPLFALMLAAPAAAAPPDGQSEGVVARHALRAGRVLPIREIERRVVPTMPGAQYLGFDFEMPSAIYTLKFLRDGAVIWIDVDGRSGQIIGRTGR